MEFKDTVLVEQHCIGNFLVEFAERKVRIDSIVTVIGIVSVNSLWKNFPRFSTSLLVISIPSLWQSWQKIFSHEYQGFSNNVLYCTNKKFTRFFSEKKSHTLLNEVKKGQSFQEDQKHFWPKRRVVFFHVDTTRSYDDPSLSSPPGRNVLVCCINLVMLFGAAVLIVQESSS